MSTGIAGGRGLIQAAVPSQKYSGKVKHHFMKLSTYPTIQLSIF
jgi:hypothetical protein